MSVGGSMSVGGGGGRKLSLDLMDMTAEPATVGSVPVSVGWGLGGDESDDEEEEGLGTVLACCAKELRRGKAVFAELDKVVDDGACEDGGRLAGLTERAELREYVRQVAICYRVGLRAGMTLREEGKQRRLVESVLALGQDLESLLGGISEWASIWAEETENGVGKPESSEGGAGCKVCGFDVECVAASEAVVEWGDCKCHAACLNLCLHCPPTDVLPALGLPPRPDALNTQVPLVV